tara:strand:- start:205 stop:1182 length:978 start_codon:yes stop_codon:yes gene_type:complete
MTEDFSIPLETPMTAKARELAEENSLQPSDLPKKGSGENGLFTVPDVKRAVKEKEKRWGDKSIYPPARELALENELQPSDLPKKGSGQNGLFTTRDIRKIIDDRAKKRERKRIEGERALFRQKQESYEKEFPKRMDWNWRWVENQEQGDSVDYISEEEGVLRKGASIEVKFDWRSILPYNQSHFLEVQQKNKPIIERQDGTTYPGKARWEKSGFCLGMEQADYWMIVNDHTVWILHIERLCELLNENYLTLFPLKETRQNVGGNRDWKTCMGFSIPFALLDQYCDLKIRNTVPREKQHIIDEIDDEGSDLSGCTCCNGDSRPYDD